MRLFMVPTIVVLLFSTSVLAQKKHVEIPDSIPYGQTLNPLQQEPVFAVCSKQGMRVLVSRDDGKTWKQTFLATESIEDGGWHGTFAVYGMAATRGVIGVFSGWGTPGVYIGSDNARDWTHFSKSPAKLGSVWGAAGGNGIMLTSADQWRGMTSNEANFQTWNTHKVKPLLGDGKTHHMMCAFGDYGGGRFVVVGDNHHVFYSEDDCKTWKHSRIPDVVGERHQAIAYANGVFVVCYKTHIARSTDGGATWTAHEHGLIGRGISWRGLSRVKNEFWLTSNGGSHARKSKDGVTWSDLPASTPGGRFASSPDGTIINVERRRFDIKRSVDGVNWTSVFTAPANDVTWDTAFAVHAKVNAIR